MSKLSVNSLHDVFVKYAHELGGFIGANWPREQDVADIVQESFLRFSQTSNPEQIQNPRAFLFQTAANMVVDRHRRRAVRDRYLENHIQLEDDYTPHNSPESYWQTQEALEHLSHWLQELPELQRHAFVLYRMEGFSHAEVAERLGISVRCSERYLKQVMEHISSHLAHLDENTGGF